MQRRGRGAAGLLLAAAVGGCGGSGGGGPSQGPAPSGTPAATTPASSSSVITDGVPIAQRDPALLTIGYIERLPRMDYVWNSASPATEGWPAEGQAVTWRAHLTNWSASPLSGVDYSWLMDGAPLTAGTVTLSAGENTLDLPWTWTRARQSS